MAFLLEGPTLAALALLSTFLRHLRSLYGNNLGPAGGMATDGDCMAIAEALKGNTTLKTLMSAALPSNSIAHALPPDGVHVPYTGPSHILPTPLRSLNGNNLGPAVGMAFADALEGNATLTFLGSAALPYASNPPAHASRSFTALHASVYFTPSTLSLEASEHRPV